MRVIKTEMHFSEVQSTEFASSSGFRHLQQKPGTGSICFAWIKGGYLDQRSIEKGNGIAVFSEPSLALPRLIDASLRDVSFSDLLMGIGDVDQGHYPERGIYNQRIVEEILRSSFIVENSPPEEISVKSLLSQDNAIIAVGVSIGTGFAFGVGAPFLVIVTVPAGVIVMGAALGVSTGLANGLSHWIKTKISKS